MILTSSWPLGRRVLLKLFRTKQNSLHASKSVISGRALKKPYSFELWLSQLAISSENDILFPFIYALRPNNFFHI